MVIRSTYNCHKRIVLLHVFSLPLCYTRVVFFADIDHWGLCADHMPPAFVYILSCLFLYWVSKLMEGTADKRQICIDTGFQRWVRGQLEVQNQSLACGSCQPVSNEGHAPLYSGTGEIRGLVMSLNYIRNFYEGCVSIKWHIDIMDFNKKLFLWSNIIFFEIKVALHFLCLYQ